MKLDPYLNVDPGTMSPFQHGEVFVTADGAETDLDLGHYERFIDENASKLSNVTTGKIYSQVINRERKGSYLGRTIQIVPHITQTIKDEILRAGNESKADIVLIEIGGTVGDIEGQPYIESIRQMRHELGQVNTLVVHLTLLPYLQASKELKTKPTQASVRELRSMGIQPDFILTRADYPIHQDILKKISLFCDVTENCVIPAPTVKSIYEVPLNFNQHHLAELIIEKLDLPKRKPNMKNWENLVKKIRARNKELKIAMVGKYTGLDDAYISVIESLKIAGYHKNRSVKILWIESEKLEKNDKTAWEKLNQASGIVVPGGFGVRGVEGKILAAQYAREKKIPYLGLCLGLQIMTIEFARHALKNPKITSEEFDEEGKISKENYIIHFLPGQNKDKEKGGTLRLGTYPCHIKKGTLTHRLYKKDLVEERHRHRYEINNAFRDTLDKHGWVASGMYKKHNLIEIAELKNHPFMVGSQFHPEFLSRPNKPHPLFAGLIQTAIKKTKGA